MTQDLRPTPSTTPSVWRPGSLVLLAALAGLGYTQEAEDGDQETFTLHFAWPEEGEVAIRKLIEIDGTPTDFDFVLRWAPDETGTESIFRYTDFDFRVLSGIGGQDPSFEAMATQAAQVYRTLPVFRIDRHGRFAGFHDFAATLAAMVQAMSQSPGVPPGSAALTFADPSMQQMLKNRPTESWMQWVQTWLDRKLHVGDRVSSEVTIPSNHPGQTIPGFVTIDCLERLQHGGEDCVRLALTADYRGDELRRSWILEARQYGFQGSAESVLDVTRRETLQGIYEIASLKPHHIEVDTVVEMKLIGADEPQRRVEREVLDFDWTRAEKATVISGKEVIRLRYAWPPEGRVSVRESGSKGGNDVVMHYDVLWRPSVDGTETVYELADFTFEILNGVHAVEPSFEPLSKQIAPIYSAVPGFRVDARGHFLGFLDLDEGIGRVIESLAGSLSRPEIERVKQALSNARTRETMRRHSYDAWQYWVEYWIEYETVVGDLFTTEASLPSGIPGETIPGVVTVGSLERFDHLGGDCVRLTMSAEYDPEAMRRSVVRRLRERNPDAPEDVLVSSNRVDTLEGIYEIDTLKPHHVEYTSTSTVVLKTGEDPGTRVDRRVFDFTWE